MSRRGPKFPKMLHYRGEGDVHHQRRGGEPGAEVHEMEGDGKLLI